MRCLTRPSPRHAAPPRRPDRAAASAKHPAPAPRRAAAVSGPAPAPTVSPRATPPAAAGPTTPTTPASAAAALAGTWLADYGASSNRGPLLAALGLGGLARLTADKLIEGVRLTATPTTLTYTILSVVPFVSAVERIDLNGAVARGPRRDGAPGEQRVTAGVAAGGRLAVTLTWGAPRAASLVETYTLAGDVLTVDAVLTPAAPPGAAAVTARTLYRRAAAWAPKYRFPGGGGGGAPASTRRAVVLALSAAAGAAALAPAAEAAPSPPTLPPVFGGPPPPPTFPRRTLDRALAVLLLRSAYDALDGMDVVGMDGWQARFWQLRADRYTR